MSGRTGAATLLLPLWKSRRIRSMINDGECVKTRVTRPYDFLVISKRRSYPVNLKLINFFFQDVYFGSRLSHQHSAVVAFAIFTPDHCPFHPRGKSAVSGLLLQPRWLLDGVTILSLPAGADNHQGRATCAMILPSAAAALSFTHPPMKAMYMADAIRKSLQGPNDLYRGGGSLLERSNRALIVVPPENFGRTNSRLMLPRIRSRNDCRRCWRMPRRTRTASWCPARKALISELSMKLSSSRR